MIFVLVFIVGTLIVPLLLDRYEHGSNNIFQRSGRDILRYAFIRQGMQSAAHFSTGRASAVVGVIAVAGVLFLGFGILSILEMLIELF